MYTIYVVFVNFIIILFKVVVNVKGHVCTLYANYNCKIKSNRIIETIEDLIRFFSITNMIYNLIDTQNLTLT